MVWNIYFHNPLWSLALSFLRPMRQWSCNPTQWQGLSINQDLWPSATSIAQPCVWLMISKPVRRVGITSTRTLWIFFFGTPGRPEKQTKSGGRLVYCHTLFKKLCSARIMYCDFAAIDIQVGFFFFATLITCHEQKPCYNIGCRIRQFRFRKWQFIFDLPNGK